MNADYQHSRRRGLDRLGDRWEINRVTEQEHKSQRGRFERLADPSAAPRAVSSFNLFQTPVELADRLVAIASEGRALGDSVLEPSAGLGRLHFALRRAGYQGIVRMIEIHGEVFRELTKLLDGDRWAFASHADFLECKPSGEGWSDTIIMNPPFKNGLDIKHVEHALTFLNPGGRLVSLVADGPRQREKLKRKASQWHTLSAGAFRSEGTGVAAAIVVFDKKD